MTGVMAVEVGRTEVDTAMTNILARMNNMKVDIEVFMESRQE